MPTDTVIVIVGIVAAFTIFSLTLFIADHRSRKH